jgi:excisionase family DNA binding protein
MRTTAEPVLVIAGRVAEALGISVASVYRLAAAGDLPSVRDGGSVRFDPEAVAAAVTSNRGRQ